MKSYRTLLTLFALLFLFSTVIGVSCNDDDDDEDNALYEPRDPGAACNADTEFCITSTAFNHGDDIPEKYTCLSDEDQYGISPPINWFNVPDGASFISITVRDPDSPSGDTHHWGIINLDAGLFTLEEGISPLSDDLPGGAWQTENYKGETRYAGPCPPEGDLDHRYYFTIYAFAQPVEPPPPGVGLSLDLILEQLEEDNIGKATLTGFFGR